MNMKVGINHLGDWGTQFGKLIVAYKLWGDKDDIEKRGIRALLDIYVRFHKEAEKDDSLNDESSKTVPSSPSEQRVSFSERLIAKKNNRKNRDKIK